MLSFLLLLSLFLSSPVASATLSLPSPSDEGTVSVSVFSVSGCGSGPTRQLMNCHTGDLLTVYGSNFSAPLSAFLSYDATRPCSNVRVFNSSVFTCSLPPGPTVQAWTSLLIVAGNDSATLSQCVMYAVGPVIYGVTGCGTSPPSPNPLLCSTGAALTVVGGQFIPQGLNVTLRGNAGVYQCTNASVQAQGQQVVCRFPAVRAADVNVTLGLQVQCQGSSPSVDFYGVRAIGSASNGTTPNSTAPAITSITGPSLAPAHRTVPCRLW